MKTLIISGSSRINGNTSKIVNELKDLLQAECIDLISKNISAYDYDHKNHGDDFLPLMKDIVKFDTLVFVSPVYWYAMSGTMKIFFDRITDCLKIDKETGRKLRGMNLAAVSVGSDDEELPSFFMPFEKSAAYLGMNYLGNLHSWLEHHEISKAGSKSLIDFAKHLQNAFEATSSD